MRLGDELVAVEQRDLEVREVGVEPTPVEVAGRVVVHVLRERHLREALEADVEQVRPVGVADEVHARSRSATASAARPSSPAREAELVRRGRADVHARGLDAERVGKSMAHLLAVRRDLRLLADQHTVGVDERVARLAHLRVGVAEEMERVGAVPARVAGGEERADVAEPCGPEHGVDESVCDHVAVRVPREPAGMVDRDAAEHEPHVVLERVRVDAEADAELRHRQPPATPRAT